MSSNTNCAVCHQIARPEAAFHKNELVFCSMAHVRQWMAEQEPPRQATTFTRPLHMCGSGGGDVM